MWSIRPTAGPPTLGRKRGFFEELMGGVGSVGGGLPTQN